MIKENNEDILVLESSLGIECYKFQGYKNQNAIISKK